MTTGGRPLQNSAQHAVTFAGGDALDVYTLRGVIQDHSLGSPDRLAYQLYFAGYPDNPYINFRNNGSNVVVDPTIGLTENSTTARAPCRRLPSVQHLEPVRQLLRVQRRDEVVEPLALQLGHVPLQVIQVAAFG